MDRMEELEHCIICGRLIPPRLEGSCPSCYPPSYVQERDAQAQRQHKLEKKHKPEKEQAISQVYRQPLRFQEVTILDQESIKRERRRLGIFFNRLLEIFYETPVLLSSILRQLGYDADQIAFWRNDNVWIAHFLVRLDNQIAVMIRQIDPQLFPIWIDAHQRCVPEEDWSDLLSQSSAPNLWNQAKLMQALNSEEFGPVSLLSRAIQITSEESMNYLSSVTMGKG